MIGFYFGMALINIWDNFVVHKYFCDTFPFLYTVINSENFEYAKVSGMECNYLCMDKIFL